MQKLADTPYARTARAVKSVSCVLIPPDPSAVKDWSLSFDYRASRLKLAIAGLARSSVVGRALAALSRDRIKNRGLTFDTSASVISPAVKASLAWGMYESAEVRFVRRYIGHEDREVVELGGSLGVVGSHALSCMASDGTFVSVEANPQLIENLGRTLSHHAQGQTVHVLHGAVHYADTPPVFSVRDSTATGSIGDTGVLVPAVTLGSILSQFSVPDGYVLISDIEGAEAQMLLHDAAAIKRCRTAIVEFHSTLEASLSDLRERFLSLGFREVAAHGAVVVLERIQESGSPPRLH